MKYSPSDVARQFLFVRELPNNRGQRVQAIQTWGGGKVGDSWCSYFATMVLDICFQGQSPIPRFGAVQDVYNLALKNKWMVDQPLKDDLFIYVDDNNHGHHIGIVTVDGGLMGIAGNTSGDGASDNGDRVAEHGLSNNPKHVKYIRFPR